MAVVEIPKNELHGEIIYPNELIVKCVGRVALEIAEKYERHASDLLVMPLLDGAGPVAELLQEEMASLGFWPEFFPVKVATYDANNNPVEPQLVTPLPRDIFRPGRHYLPTDDMLHTGTTMAFMNQDLRNRGLIKKDREGQVKHLANFAMIDRIDQQEKDVIADFAAFRTHLEDWLVGYGLDDQRLKGLSEDCGRYLPFVAKALSIEEINALRAERDLPALAA